ncbi:MAG: glycoside hydrolase family 125 protein [Armatimonadota bacterium]|nr:glycoside hydrolase family 125 protein [Armatimonadota bacterium]MDR5697560.1 glycoside hydrolase family 125 protein [Armatimonadota bacterium]
MSGWLPAPVGALPVDPPVGRHAKPWDAGDGTASASLGSDGRVLSMHRPHTRHGWFHLAGFPPFPEDRRRDPEFVRTFRRSMGDPSGPGLSVRPRGMGSPERGWVAHRIPAFRWRADGLAVWWIPFVRDGRLICWLHARSRRPDGPAALTVEFAPTLGVVRAAYGQITEGGPLPPYDARNRVRWVQGAVWWEAPGLPGWARVGPAPRVADCERMPPVALRWDVTLDLSEGCAEHVLVAELGETEFRAPLAIPSADDVHAWLHDAVGRACAPEVGTEPAARWWIHRNLAFALDVCAVDVGEGTCLVTDPVLLPLSWNRDAYYVACLLGAFAVRNSGSPLGQTARRALRRHLTWLFDVAARPDGLWGRSHLTNGEVKDRAFQLDQQWYPLLELARAALEWGQTDLWDRHRRQALRSLDALLAMRSALGLFPTSETPADDPLSLPYHFSSHVLAWRTLALLSRLPGCERLLSETDRLRGLVERHFRIRDSGIYAYATDGEGGHRRYHDANDLPTACAARWGFCAPDDVWWRRTIVFAYSAANAGWFDGPFGGLGSVHAPGPWTLGDIQRWIVAHDTGDAAAKAAAEQRLRAVAFDDGLLCESYDAHSGLPRTRAWFAWPGAVLAALLLGDSL